MNGSLSRWAGTDTCLNVSLGSMDTRRHGNEDTPEKHRRRGDTGNHGGRWRQVCREQGSPGGKWTQVSVNETGQWLSELACLLSGSGDECGLASGEACQYSGEGVRCDWVTVEPGVSVTNILASLFIVIKVNEITIDLMKSYGVHFYLCPSNIQSSFTVTARKISNTTIFKTSGGAFPKSIVNQLRSTTVSCWTLLVTTDLATRFGTRRSINNDRIFTFG